MLAALKRIDVARECQAAGAKQARADCIRYFQNHCSKMDYPRYLANGWQIGSGPVKGACKTVVGNRLKGGGMRWGEPARKGPTRIESSVASSGPPLTPKASPIGNLAECGNREW